ncbi:C2 and GRAM domain-containing protein At5g50170 isoform X2 [Benincasa hispida]|uniref:C2 and GRAM domain-containing protein At5g50170 isoform X2 n=1 Tax=Benincasa hispida TaxID=102211 RepID=UPI0019011C11|nr:C2 and GRAM domain-containing protein At5g50170 isoform X2 [Benincasa hispida]
MRLYVYVLEAKDLDVKDSYVKLRVGRRKAKTRIMRNCSNPVWNEEFIFKFRDVDDELVVSVYEHSDESNFFHASSGLIGRVRIPIWTVAAEDSQTLPPTWFDLRRSKTEKFINEVTGKVLLIVSLHGKGNVLNQSSVTNTNSTPLEGSSAISQALIGAKSSSSKAVKWKPNKKTIVSRLERLFHKSDGDTRTDDSSESSSAMSDTEELTNGHPSESNFDEAIEALQLRSNEQEMPENLSGGVLVDQVYVVSTGDLNKLLFSPDSQFRRELAEHQGITNLEEGTWSWKQGDIPCLSRIVSYRKPPTKVVGAINATEEQTYIKGDGWEFAVLVNVSTPEVPFGNAFNVELLYKIIPGPELISGEETSHFVVSWGINFVHSTIMKGMIEKGARQGLEENFVQFTNLLAQHLKIPNSTELLNKDHVLSTSENDRHSTFELASQYFWNFTVFSTMFFLLYVLVHIILSKPKTKQGLEFTGMDLPDSLGELVTSGILVLQLERVYNMVSHFVQARLKRGGDHGVKGRGDGWILTIALIEGVNISSLDSSGSSDPCVVFTCNGKKRTSSVELQTHEPQWNEILEFDAMKEPPSVLFVEVFDFDGPFDQATSLGHAEINFLKYKSTELADIWVSLEGKLAQSSQSKLHLRIFLDNTDGVETIRQYLSMKGKEVGKKLHPRSPYRNSAFQKLFSLPTEEFLVSDFTCSLKRKMLLQKTKFFFLWEDIEDIQVLHPSLSSLGSPSLVIILKQGRGLEASHGAKSQDEQGRLKFYLQSFVSFNVASRTIMGMWKTRTLALDQKAQVAETSNDSEERSVLVEDVECFLDVEDTKMSKLYVAELPLNVKSLMEFFEGGKLEHRVMEKSGCLNYMTTPWEFVKPNILERRISYQFNHDISIFEGKVTCIQQKFPMTGADAGSDEEEWVLNEVMSLHDVPFGDCFRIHFRYCFEDSELAKNACKCKAFYGITWLKSTELQQKITQNIADEFGNRLKVIFELIEREILFATQQNSIT